MPLVDNCCIIAHPSKSYCMCIITPNLKKAQELLDSNESNGNTNHSNENQSQDTIGDFINLMESNSKLSKSFDKELVDFCLSHGLERFEIPTKSKFVKEIWLPDSGLVTDSLKLKRREIEKFYENEIKTTYV
jgi:long-chain acyl-CoA synthetase